MKERFRRMQEADHRFQRNLALNEYADALAAYRDANTLGTRLTPDLDPANFAHRFPYSKRSGSPIR